MYTSITNVCLIVCVFTVRKLKNKKTKKEKKYHYQRALEKSWQKDKLTG